MKAWVDGTRYSQNHERSDALRTNTAQSTSCPSVTQFIHLADAKQIPAIRRTGIAARKVRGEELRGFYCTLVSRNGFRTHQWLRELKRRGVKTFKAVQFYLPSSTEVF